MIAGRHGAMGTRKHAWQTHGIVYCSAARGTDGAVAVNNDYSVVKGITGQEGRVLDYPVMNKII